MKIDSVHYAILEKKEMNFTTFFIGNNDVIRKLRGKYIPNYYTNNPSAYKMKGLLSLCNKNVIEKLRTFLKKIGFNV